MSVFRISPIKNASVNDSTPTNQPPIAPKPKPKPRRIKSVPPNFQTGLTDTEGKSLGTHLSYMRQKELFHKQYNSPNHHSVIDSRIPSQIRIPELPEKNEDNLSNHVPIAAPPPPPASTIPLSPTELSSSPTNCTDRDDITKDDEDETIPDEKGTLYFNTIDIHVVLYL